MKNVQVEDVWLNKKVYEDAETRFHENLTRAALNPLAGEAAKAREKLIENRDTFSSEICTVVPFDTGAFKFIEKKVVEFEKAINQILDQLKSFDLRVSAIENLAHQSPSAPIKELDVKQQPHIKKEVVKNDEDDDVDLFASDSDEESSEAAKIREERLAAYAIKKSKKPALIAKSNIILDVKPWDDETDMKLMEQEVRKIQCDGLLWGAAKLVPLAFGIHKLQISSVVEDDKVSIDWLTEQIEAIEDYVQSVDIAAFNKI